MGEALKQRNRSTSPVEEEPQMAHPTHVPLQTLKPIIRLSPRHNGSTLLDSFEIRAVTNQLNKAIQGVNASSPTFTSFMKSPFYSRHLSSIYKENPKTPKRITCSKFGRVHIPSSSTTGTGQASRGFVSRLWQKVKRGLLKNMQRNKR